MDRHRNHDHHRAGCCRGIERKNTQMCIEKDGREMCDRSGKCEFIVTDDAEDCEYDTTTSEPWLNAQAEQQESQYAHTQQRSYSGNSKRSGKKSANSMMFAAANGETTSTVEQAMQTQVSLATLLMFVVAAVALYQMFLCVAQSNGGGYKQIRNADTSAVYQSV